MSTIPLPYLISAVGAALVCFLFWPDRRPLPNGPKRVPIFGNALQMPRLKEWEIFPVWARKYGDLTFLKIFGHEVLVVNTVKAARDLCEKRGAIYSSRPHRIVACSYVGLDRSLALMPYGTEFRMCRKLAAQEFSPINLSDAFASCEKEAGLLLRRLVAFPDAVEWDVKDTIGSLLCVAIMGYQIKRENDPVIRAFARAAHAFSVATAPGSFAVDYFPWLDYVPSWLPGGRWKKVARFWREDVDVNFDDVFTHATGGIANGTAKPSFLSRLLNGGNVTPEQDYYIKWTAASLVAAGMDTTSAAVLFFFLSMTVHPLPQKRAQEEIDRVIGRDRLPTLADRNSLPYVNSLVKETLRWFPVSPVGVPHALIQDDVYNGRFIPKGTVIIPNQQSMLHDPEVYPDPESFLPERFLPTGDKAADDAIDPKKIAFGFGRRICPGAHLADVLTFTIAANVLATMNISLPISKETGEEYIPPIGAMPGNISYPIPFECTVKPRDARAAELINLATEELAE